LLRGSSRLEDACTSLQQYLQLSRSLHLLAGDIASKNVLILDSPRTDQQRQQFLSSSVQDLMSFFRMDLDPIMFPQGAGVVPDHNDSFSLQDEEELS
jgi:hypothetical protein